MIGVFDSGVGGLSVLNEIRRILPEADLVYVADRARAPFGVRELSEVEAISHEVAGWLIGRGADCVVIACNTASAAALESIRRANPEMVVVGMEPAIKPAAAHTLTGKVAVYATKATFQGELFASVVSRFADGVEVITCACPEWVETVEAGHVEGAEVEELVRHRLQPALDAGADTIVLACTHFSYLRPVIESHVDVTVIDPVPAVAERVAEVAPTPAGDGSTILASSGDLAEFADLALRLAGISANVIPFAP
ncbi:MAG: glutamate racemase [Acidimicrobiia bacterium]